MSFDDENFLGIPKSPKPDSPSHPIAPDISPRRVFRKSVAYVSACMAIVVIVFLLFLAIPNSLNPEVVRFEIEKGASVRSIARDLKELELIRSTLLFEAEARLFRLENRVQSGIYLLSRNMSTLEVLGAFTSQQAGNEVTITTIEGWTVQDIAQYIDGTGITKAADFLRAAEKDYSDEFEFLKDAPKKDTGFSPLEGYVFPDTYRVFNDASADDIIHIMLKNFDMKLTQQMRNEIILQRKTIRDSVIMASIIEREVRTQKDKALVSGILWKRLRLGIALQADASVVYVKTDGRSRTAVDKVYLEDLKIDSPYNTYKYRGLPPAPISNPGIESIKAAIFPASSAYLYYLSAPDGTTIFSKTLEEHNANKAKYLK